MKAQFSSGLFQKLHSYKKKYYINQLFKGCILFFALLFAVYLLINTAEYFGRFNYLIRAILFFSFILIVSLSFTYWILTPTLRLFNLQSQLSNEEAARQIGSYFSDINDRLLNTLQLESLDYHNNQLLEASIEQKTQQLSVINFSEAINFKENNRYIKLAVFPATLILLILFFTPNVFTESSERIVNFKSEYTESAPFTFVLSNKSLRAFQNEDFPISVSLQGKALPEDVYVVADGRRYKMESTDKRNYTFTVSDIQKSIPFHFEAASYNSTNYELAVVNRPNLQSFNAYLSYPAYLNKQDERLTNIGDLTVPDGTNITWELKSTHTDSLSFQFGESPMLLADRKADAFIFSKKLRSSGPYQLILKNGVATNKEKIAYNINVIPDKFPQITLEQMKDTTLYSSLFIGGNIVDDYGFTQLRLYYRVTRSGDAKENTPYLSKKISLNPTQTIQNYFYEWSLDSLKLNSGDALQYYVQVWDNDGINGSKSAKSIQSEFKLPSKEKIEENIAGSSSKTENQMNQALNQANKLKKDINSLENRLKTKKNTDFQDKKLAEEILKKHNDLLKEIDQIQKQQKELAEKQKKFSDQSQQLAEKAEQLNKLMQDILDEETKKLYQELQKLIENNRNNTEALDLINKIKTKDANLNKELERALEMFKRIQVEQKLDNVVNDLKENAKKEEELADKTLEKEKTNNNTNDNLKQEQNKLNEDFNKTKEQLKQIEELNKDLETPVDISDDTKPEESEISEEQEKSLEQLEQNKNKKAAESQKKAAEKMNKMADKLSQMKSDAETEEMQENLDDLRNILENLLKLSFDQEQLMKDFREVNSSDPRFNSLSQKQLKLKDDSRIVEDSLIALSKRVFQIKSFVTREVGAMNEYMDQSVDAIRQRRISNATGKQQFAMTSMNNLALMLNDVLDQMQEQMANAKPGKGKKKQGRKPNPGESLGNLQQQLNNKIQQLKQSGKSGQQLSEELSKLSLEQEMIRKAFNELRNAQKGKNEGPSDSGMGELMKKMEETEQDLVNKKIDQNTINRQKDILTRLLESEKSLREREEDTKRNSQTAKPINANSPSNFEDYIKLKNKQVDLLKTIAPSLSPYYKKEVDKYFDRIKYVK